MTYDEAIEVLRRVEHHFREGDLYEDHDRGMGLLAAMSEAITLLAGEAEPESPSSTLVAEMLKDDPAHGVLARALLRANAGRQVSAGRAHWLWDDELSLHVPCCSVRPASNAYACQNGPLTGEQILTGDCGRHSEGAV